MVKKDIEIQSKINSALKETNEKVQRMKEHVTTLPEDKQSHKLVEFSNKYISLVLCLAPML